MYFIRKLFAAQVIAVDFDGVLCRNGWPRIGKAHVGIIVLLRTLRGCGKKLILYTCREGDLLREAVDWCKAHGLEFDAVNENLPERIALYGGDCRKISADAYLDDLAIPVWGGRIGGGGKRGTA